MAGLRTHLDEEQRTPDHAPPPRDDGRSRLHAPDHSTCTTLRMRGQQLARRGPAVPVWPARRDGRARARPGTARSPAAPPSSRLSHRTAPRSKALGLLLEDHDLQRVLEPDRWQLHRGRAHCRRVAARQRSLVTPCSVSNRPAEACWRRRRPALLTFALAPRPAVRARSATALATPHGGEAGAAACVPREGSRDRYNDVCTVGGGGLKEAGRQTRRRSCRNPALSRPPATSGDDHV
jgi:hypothetical protein